MRRLTLAAATLLAATAPALAQFDPTVVPNRPAQPAPPPQPAVREVPLGPAQPAGGDSLPAQGVYQQGLDSLDPSSPGILTQANGGFPAGLWQGTDRRALVALMPRMPVGKGSPAMRSLAERLLLTEAQVPQGNTRNVYDVFQARIDRLVAAGYAAEVADLFSRVPEKIPDARLAHARVDALLLTGEAAVACDEALSANQRSEETSWLETVAYCKLIQGDGDGAGFTADMLRETGADDPDFFAMLAWLGQPEEARGDKPKLANTQPLTPLKLVMLKAVGVAVAASTLDRASPLVLVAVANDESLPPETRLEAAERAARVGAIGARDLAAAYAAGTIDPARLADPLAAASGMPGGPGGALLYQAAMQASDPIVRLKILQTIWARAKADGTYLLAARVNVEAAKALLPPPAPEPAAAPVDAAGADGAPVPLAPGTMPAVPEPPAAPPELVDAARDIVRALLAAGEVDVARHWYDMVRDKAAAGDPNATAAQAQLWPLMVVADAKTGFEESGFEGWWQGQMAQPRIDRSRHGTVLMAVLEGLGQPVQQSFWGGLYDGADAGEGALPPLPVWRGLVAAGDAGRLGETVLLSLVVLGDGGPGGANPAALVDVLKALEKVGLQRDARALALEALIAAGF
jgi:hypothetical protein